MTFFLFAGDMLVMAFMIGLAIWCGYKGNDDDIRRVAALPLEDDEHHG